MKSLQNISYKTLFTILFLSLAGIVFFLKIGGKTQKVSAAWWDEMWHYRKAISITNSSGSNLTDFQVSVSIGTSQLIADGKMQNNCNDIRVTDINGNLLPYWIEENNPGCNSATGDTKIWLKANSLPTSGATVYIYYGNSQAVNNENGDNVFEFFDDFNGTSIDTNKWQMLKTNNTDASSYWSQTAGSLQVNPVLSGIATITSKNFTIQNGVIETRYIGTTASSDPDNDMLFIWRWQDYRNFYFFHHDYANPANTTCANLPADNVNISKLINGTESCLTWIAAPSSDEYPNWYNAIIKFNDNNYSVNYSKYPSNWYDVIDTSITSAGRVGFGKTHNEEHPKWDYIFVHKYASTQPTTSNQSEETGGGPIAYWKFDEGVGTTAYDSAGDYNGIFGTVSPPQWTENSNCISGNCINIGTSSTYISSGTIDTSQDFTITTWVKPTIFLTGWNRIIFGTTNDIGLGYLLVDANTAKIKLTKTNNVDAISSTKTIKINEWSFISVTFNNSTKSVSYYINGKLSDSFTFNYSFVNSNKYIGYTSFNGQGMVGFLDELKIYPYARTADQIKQDYNSRGSSSSQGSSVNLGSNKSSNSLTDGLIGYWKMDEGVGTNITDSSGNNNTGTFGTGTSAPTWSSGKYGIGLSFATNQYVQLSSIVDTTIKSYSYWIYQTSASGSQAALTSNNLYHMASYGGTNNLSTLFPDDQKRKCTSTIPLNTWAFVYLDLINDKIYLNGTDCTEVVTMSWSHDPFTGLIIGKSYSGYGAPLGKMDEIRAYNRALSPAEVSALYNYAPGPIAYWNFNDGSGTTIIDKSGNGNNGTLGAGNSAPTWSQGKIGSALYWDGSSNKYASLSKTSDIGNKSFTISGWVNIPPTPARTGIFLGNFSDTPHMNLEVESTLRFYWNGLDIHGTTNIKDNNWHYTTWVRDKDSSQIRMYIDGKLEIGYTGGAGSDLSFTTPFLIGSDKRAGGMTWHGKIDEVKIYNYARNQKQIIEDMNAGAPATSAKSMVAYYKFDEGNGTIANNSGNGGSTLNGTLGTGVSTPTWQTENQCIHGKCLNILKGSNYSSRVLINSSTPVSNVFTISHWLKTTSTGYTVWNSGNGNGYRFGLSNGRIGFLAGNSNGYTETKCGTKTVNDNKWHFIAGIFNPITRTFTCYIDGKYEATVNTIDFTGFSTAATMIGGYNFDGLIDDVKIYNYALTADEIKQDYNQGTSISFGSTTQNIGGTTTSLDYCIPGDTSYCAPPVTEYKMDEGVGTSIIDTSGNNNAGTLVNSPTWVQGKIGKALNFNTNKYVNTVSSNTLLSGDTSFTIQSWFKTNQLYNTGDPNIGGRLVTLYRSSGSTKIGLGLYGNNTDTLMAFTNTSPTGVFKTNSNFNDNKWHYLSTTYDSSTDILKLFYDGIEVGSTNVGTISSSDSSVAQIGTLGGSYNFNGSIDHVKIYNYARTPAQIAYDYNKGGPVGWWKFDECQGNIAYDWSGIGNTGTIIIGASGSQNSLGTCQIGTSAAWTNGASGKINSSLNFDGVDDYININDNDILDPTEITISAWVKPNVLNGGNFISKGNNDGYRMRIYADGSIGFLDRGGTNILATAIGTCSINTWYHIVGIGNSNGLKIYVNGKLIAQNSTPYGSPNTSLVLNIGQGYTSERFNGQIDDVRIYNYALTSEQVKQVYNGGAVNFR